MQFWAQIPHFEHFSSTILGLKKGTSCLFSSLPFKSKYVLGFSTSQSMRRTLYPSFLNIIAILTAHSVFPVPPLPPVTQIILGLLLLMGIKFILY